MDQKDFKKMWSNFLIDIDKKAIDIANDEGVTRQTISRKINNASIRFVDFVNILERYGYTVKIIKKE